MATDRHTHTPLRYRPPEAERLWLAAYQERTSKPINAILTEAVRRLMAEELNDEAPPRALLRQAADALTDCAKAALTIRPELDQPYPDYPQWTPYTRWVERPAEQAHNLAVEIRRYLGR